MLELSQFLIFWVAVSFIMYFCFIRLAPFLESIWFSWRQWRQQQWHQQQQQQQRLSEYDRGSIFVGG
jgi:hypothetical protein